MSIELAPVNPVLLHQTFLEAFADYAMDARGTTETALLLRMSKNAVDYDASVGAYTDGRMVGFTLIGIDTMPHGLTAYDAGTGLIPEYRGRGIARRMFDHALPELRSRGVRRFTLEVLQENDAAIRTYRKSGFEIARTLRCYVADVGNLITLDPKDGHNIRAVSSVALDEILPDADWIPSFENRFTAPQGIPSEVAYYAAHDEEMCVGVVTYCARLNWLLSLVVKRSHRRRGIGRSLLGHLARCLPRSIRHLAVLNVDGDDAGMQKFLTSCGFRHLVDQYEMTRAL
jgi:ribosomal protein S18 acetylase RimI-like enzyme